MRSFYSTHKHVRLFVFGVPEGWQTAIYDLEKHKWMDQGRWLHETLREAKVDVKERAATLLGKKLPENGWH